MIYFMQPTAGGPVKIGFSGNVEARRKALESHYGKPLAVLATLEGDRAQEQELHRQFSHLRFGKTEQFRPEADLMNFIGRPLLVGANPDVVEMIEPVAANREVIVHLKGSTEYAEWLEQVHRATHISKATLFRLAMSEWAQNYGHSAPPEI